MIAARLIILSSLLLTACATVFAGMQAHGPENAEDSIEESPAPVTIDSLLARADAALARGWLVVPSGRSAMDLYLQALAKEPENREARDGLVAVYRATLEAALLLARELDFDTAENLLAQAESLEGDARSFERARREIRLLQQQYLEKAKQSVLELIRAARYEQAEDEITDLIAIGLPRHNIEELRRALADAKRYGTYRPGQTFRDPLGGDPGRFGPEMVVIPSGRFMMGSPESESGRRSNEGPRHLVVIESGFALGLTEITVTQFAEFAEQTGYVTDAENAGWSRVYEPRSGRMQRRRSVDWRNDYLGRKAAQDLPVIHVSWRDARAYADWLADQTGQPYRLPSEAEFEYALRANSQTLYWWGEETPPEALENLTGDGDLSPTGARWSSAFPRYRDGHWGPAPVASFPANPFGLHDMGGNVMEWTEDCWHDSFVRAPSDGTAWVNPGCRQRVIRGGSWSSTPEMSRSAYRIAGNEDSSDIRLGFRVARDLGP